MTQFRFDIVPDFTFWGGAVFARQMVSVIAMAHTVHRGRVLTILLDKGIQR